MQFIQHLMQVLLQLIQTKIWNCFQKNISLAAKKGRIFGTDQVALALSIYEDKNIDPEYSTSIQITCVNSTSIF